MEIQVLQKALISTALVGILGLLFRLYTALVANPKKLRSALRKQGISGPPPTLLLGNLREIKKARTAKPPPMSGAPTHHNCANALFPFLEHWKNKYGSTSGAVDRVVRIFLHVHPLGATCDFCQRFGFKSVPTQGKDKIKAKTRTMSEKIIFLSNVFMFALGNNLILHVTQQDMVREITTCTSLDLGKPSYQAKDRGALLGQGILTSNGTHWAHQRKIIAPELYLDKVKGMINLTQESTMSLVDSWNNIIEANGGIADIKIDQYMRSFSGDVISKACFGSNYSRGEEIFFKLRALQECASKMGLSVGIPGMRYLPTKSNREAWALDKNIKTLILKVVNERNESGYEKDLLQMILEGAKNSELSPEALDHFIVDNCKNIYLAGYETTAVSATWCLMLLAANPEWQERVRAEVLEVCKGQIPDGDMIRKMKLLSMVINESLRLYPPVSIISREAFKDMKFGNINIPKGVNVWAFVLTLHTDPEVWGADSYLFNPDRFASGITGACKLPHLYMPFGVGPRVCLGQHLALVELKILISLILSNFVFTLSRTYTHSPALHLVIEPEHGVHLNVKKL